MPVQLSSSEREQLIAYFLGELSIEEAEAMEDRFAVESEYLDVLEEVERSLARQYATGRMDPARAVLFERNYLVTRERQRQVSMLQALYAVGTKQQTERIGSHKPFVLVVIAFAASVVLAAIVLSDHRRQPPEKQRQSAYPSTASLPLASQRPATPQRTTPTPARPPQKVLAKNRATPTVSPGDEVGVPKDDPRIDRVIDLAKNGLSEEFIIKDLQKSNQPIELTPFQMGRLKQGGLSEKVISAMIDPSASVPAAPAAPAAVAVAAPPPPLLEATPSASPAPSRAQEKRVVVDAFDYSAVTTQVQSIFGSQQNVGKGVQALLATRIQQGNNLVVVDRAKMKEVIAEQDNPVSNRYPQAKGPRIGRMIGADAIIAGDIVVFGRDDKKNGAGASLVKGFCRVCGAVAFSKKEEKFVIAVNYRLIDAETREVLATGEARGESKRVSRDWGAIGSSLVGGTGAGAAVDMTSSNFQQTIIGEAAQDCINKLADDIKKKAAEMKKAVREVEAYVADVSGASVTISAGSMDGVKLGETFEILRVDRELRDPVTNEVLDRVTTKVGEMVVYNVRAKIAIGTYAGQPPAIRYLARRKMPG